MMNFKPDFKPREYQKNIANIAKWRNTLVILPTGTGKTIIGLIVAIHRLNKYPDSKVIILAPTRPLANQHRETFLRFAEIDDNDIVVVTGKIRKDDRKKFYEKAKIICATPQVIKNDIVNNSLSLENISLIIFDECHRAVKDYPYTFIASEYVRKSKYPLILGLTASPGSKKEKIEEIKKNLFIKAVEMRTEWDKDIRKYIKKIKKVYIYVNLPEEIKKAIKEITIVEKELIEWLMKYNVLNTSSPKKKDLIILQKKLIEKISKGELSEGIHRAILQKLLLLIKVEYMLELLETQSAKHFVEYIKKLENSSKRHEKILVNDPRIRHAKMLIEDFLKNDLPHPKMVKLIEIIRKILSERSDAKIIVFANYRSTVDFINKKLRENGVKSNILVGQAKRSGKGMSQKEQIKIIEEFANGMFNVLICSSVGEEGLDIPKTDYAIFYEPVPSEIRSIQRRGRVGRQSTGTVIFLITKGTRDEGYYWASFHKERRMRRIIRDSKKNISNKNKIFHWLGDEK
ncbi:MAG: DEAD/DEAH box helicase family protein [Candidatus Aenigmarchaeota archaeon]|nr:DEAD/DEAH box helicase family protein [Candidatus Aenigmarchaeota archaeon]